MAIRAEGAAQGHHVVPALRCHLVGHRARHLLVVPPAHRHHPGPDRQDSSAGHQHGRRVVNAGLVIPAVIILGCALIAVIVALTTRKKRALWDIFPGPCPIQTLRHRAGPVLFDGGTSCLPQRTKPTRQRQTETRVVEDPTEESLPWWTSPVPTMKLAEWHRRYDQTVSAWIENHQRVLGDMSASGLQVDMGNRDKLLAGHEDLAPKMREAIASHPSPVMRAELSAMHVAGEAAVFAVIKGDYETARRQHLIYVQYRDEWIERLRQFSAEPMSNLRAVMNTDEFELEEIRAALESALSDTEDPEDDEPVFEAPLVVREDTTSVFDLDEHPKKALENRGRPPPRTPSRPRSAPSALFRKTPKTTKAQKA